MEFIYKALRGTLEHTSVTEDEVDRQLTRLQQQTPRMTQVTDREAVRQVVKEALNIAGERNGHLIDKPDLKSAMDYWHNHLRDAGLTGEYAPHSLRYAWAQDAIRYYEEQGLNHKEALAVTSTDLGHGDGRGRYIEQVYGQMESMYAGSMQQALGEDVTPETQARMQRFSARMTALMKQEMGWDVMAPMYVDIYSKSFSEDEIQGMLAFYRTPAGQAVIEKMPLVMQNTMQAVQQRMGAMMPAMQKMIAEEMEHTPAAAE